MAKLKPDVIEWILKLNSTQAQEEYHKLEKANRNLKKDSDAARKSMVDLEKQGKKGTEEWKNLRNSIAGYNREMSQNRAKMQEISRQMDTSTKTVSQLRKELKQLTREFEHTSKATDPKRYRELKQQIDQTKQAIREAKDATDGLKGSFSGLGKIQNMIKGFFAGVGIAIFNNFIGAFRNAFTLVVDFERENSRLAAILGTSRDGIQEMTKAARELGATTSYSAAEVTQLQIELAKLGFSRDQILAMEAGVLKFAKAVGTDLASASAFAGAALRIFGKDAADTEEVLASFAVATTKSALDFSKLETSLSIVGPVAHAAGFSLEDTTAILGLLANKGFDASSAATALRNTFLKLADGGSKLSKAIGEPVKNAEDLAKGLQKLVASGVDLQKALELTDKRSVAAFEAIMAGAGDLVSLRDSITDVTDGLDEMSGTMANNVSGALAGLKSASEELMLSIANGTEGPLKDMINALTDWVRKGQDVVKWLREHSQWVKRVVTAIAAYKLSQLAVIAVEKTWNGLIAIKNGLLGAYKAGLAAVTTTQRLFAEGVKGATLSVKAFGAALKSLPWMNIIAAVTTIIALFKNWDEETETVKESTKRLKEIEESATTAAEEHAKARDELNINIETQKEKLLTLHKIASDVNAAEKDRLDAIAALNSAIPGYNGSIDANTGKLRANTSALWENIKAMEQRMRLAYYKDEYEKYLREEEAAKMRFKKAEQTRLKWQEENSETVYGKPHPKQGTEARWYEELSPTMYKGPGMRGRSEYKAWKAEDLSTYREYVAAKRNRDAAVAKRSEFLKYAQQEGFLVDSATGTESDAGAADTTVTPKGGGSGKKSKKSGRQNSNKEDKIKKATEEIDLEYQKKITELQKEKENLSESEFAIRLAQEMIAYTDKLTDALTALKEKTGDSDKDLTNKIEKKQEKINQDAVKARQAINDALDEQSIDHHAKELERFQKSYEAQEDIMLESVTKQETTREAADIYLLTQQIKLHNEQLDELKRYQGEVEKVEYLGDQKRKERLEDIASDIRKKENEILTATGIYAEKLREMMSNPIGKEGLMVSFDSQRKAIESEYAEMIKTVEKGSAEAVALEEEKNRRLLVLEYKRRDELYQLQESVGLSWSDEWDRELLKLKEAHAEGIIEEKEYQRRRLEIGVEHSKKYFDFYSGLSQSTFSALQEAEIAMSDAKYDLLIRQAENNGEETAKLEEEKQNKQLEIQKKYADVNFAIKVSQIIADTAVSIMKAFADLGPIGGAVAAALITATGAAQVVSANAERQKIKNLQPKSSASAAESSTSPATAKRVLSGYSEGGYTGEGDRYEVAGIVHKGEYVVPKPLMANPRVIDAVGMIEALRQRRLGIASIPDPRQTGSFASGGYTSGSPDNSALTSEVRSLLSEMKEALRNVRAYIVYQDMERAQSNMERARAPFRRK